MKMKIRVNKKAACVIVALVTIVSVTAFGASKNAIWYNKEGWALLEKGQNYKALFSFKNALKKNPDYRDAIIGLAKAYAALEVYEQAYTLFNDALRLDKNNIQALSGIAFALTGMGKYTEALGYFDTVAKLSEEGLDSKYGAAYIYNLMGNRIWAKRKLDTIFKIDPYHYNSLLLMAEIKAADGRFDESRKLVQKAIDARPELPGAHVRMAEILYMEYLKTEDDDSLAEAEHSAKNGVAIDQDNFQANRMMGNISLIKKRYGDAVLFFNKAMNSTESGTMLYSIAMAYDLSDDEDSAIKYFLKALKAMPSDSLLKGRLEDFFVFRDFKIGNPARVMLNNDYYAMAVDRAKKNFPDEVIMYLRRSLLMNPMNRESREMLLDYYSTLDYNNLYIDELKELVKLYPTSANQERLAISVLKRRNRMYHKEGYSSDEVPRDVPYVLALDFSPEGVTLHPDAGSVIASNLTYVLAQFGRMKPAGIRERARNSAGLRADDDHIDKSLDKIGERVKRKEMPKVDFIVYGTYSEKSGHISADYNLLDFSRGVVVGRFSLSESGKDALPRLSLRAAKRIYDMIPFSGRILKLKDDSVVVNLGTIDGVMPGDKILIKKTAGSIINSKGDKKFVFTVKESDTNVSLAVPQKESDLAEVDSTDQVLPLRKKRAKKIE